MKLDDNGSASIEVAVLTPMVLLVLVLVVAGGRVVTAHAALDTATTSAARAASIARTAPAAQQQATATAEAALREQGVHCAQQQVSVDSIGFDRPIGQPGTVAVHAACAVLLADLTLPLMPGSIPLRSHAASPLDPYRERT
ncbi:TadE/TadG family type IV pilus assembly protein [Saccharopolyspora rosea]|uniref:TadE/TadG family type IV pilus assembly protein n=1 Tax=Saccharopolyspora rosea TaxID=524884 RepID=UPI0021DACD89|nr:TadE/TadG family type IV pilus assembly protein [Saccharopolyspora rosea]